MCHDFVDGKKIEVFDILHIMDSREIPIDETLITEALKTSDAGKALLDDLALFPIQSRELL